MTEAQQTFRAAFAALAKTIGQPLAFDENGAAIVRADGASSVVVQDAPEREGVFLWAVVTGLPEDESSAARARFLLERQDCGRETDGFWYALDPDSRRLLLQGLEDYDRVATADDLAVRLASFLSVLNATRRELAARWPSDADADTEWEDEP